MTPNNSAPAQLVEIEKPTYGGAFLGRIEGKAVFVPLTLPGEQVQVRIVESKRGYSTGEVEQLLIPSPERVAPDCRYFGACGGCNYQHTGYESQLALKQAILRETLQRGGVAVPEEIELLAAGPWGYRNRIRLAFDGAGNPGYRGRRSHAVIPVTECPIAAPSLIAGALAAATVARTSAPTLKLSEISLFCNGDESAMLGSVFIDSRSPLGQIKARFDAFARAWQAAAPSLQGAELVAEGQGADPPRTVAQWGAPSLTYRAAGFDYRVDHGAFFQVNRFLVDALVDRVAAGQRGRLAWDLFAGVGLFARRLAASFEQVIAVESAPTATAALAHNLKGTTGKALRSATLDFLRSGRKGERPDLIVVDPPRTGLGAETTTLLGQVAAPAIVYVSCDPATLARDLKALADVGYGIEKVVLADLFPQTFHLETIAHLRHA